MVAKFKMGSIVRWRDQYGKYSSIMGCGCGLPRPSDGIILLKIAILRQDDDKRKHDPLDFDSIPVLNNIFHARHVANQIALANARFRLKINLDVHVSVNEFDSLFAL